MNLKEAANHIQATLDHLEQSMGETVFDEWLLVRKEGEGWILMSYHGPRRDALLASFKKDMGSLHQVLDASDIQTGHFAFSHEGYGSSFDAYMTAGEAMVVLFNHTTKSMGQITGHPRWKTAQVQFHDLLETFLADPIG